MPKKAVLSVSIVVALAIAIGEIHLLQEDTAQSSQLRPH